MSVLNAEREELLLRIADVDAALDPLRDVVHYANAVMEDLEARRRVLKLRLSRLPVTLEPDSTSGESEDVDRSSSECTCGRCK